MSALALVDFPLSPSKRGRPPLTESERVFLLYFTLPHKVRKLIDSLSLANAWQKDLRGKLREFIRAMGTMCMQARIAGRCLKAELLDLLGISRPTFRKRLGILVDLGVLTDDGTHLRLVHWLDSNPSQAELDIRKARDREAGRVRQARHRAGKRISRLGAKNVDLPRVSAPVTRLIYKAPDASPAKPRDSALQPGLHAARVRYGGGAHAPRSAWGRPLQKAPPPRPCTDTELDALQDEFDRLDVEHARRKESLAGDPPAAPVPQPSEAILPPSLTKAAESLTDYFMARAEAMVQSGRPDVVRETPPCEPQRRLPLAHEPQARPAQAPSPARSVSDDASKAPQSPREPRRVQRPPSRPAADLAASVRDLRRLQRDHRLLGCPINLVAMARSGITYDTARQAFDLYAETRARGRERSRAKKVDNPGAYILSTARKLQNGWGAHAT